MRLYAFSAEGTSRRALRDLHVASQVRTNSALAEPPLCVPVARGHWAGLYHGRITVCFVPIVEVAQELPHRITCRGHWQLQPTGRPSAIFAEPFLTFCARSSLGLLRESAPVHEHRALANRQDLWKRAQDTMKHNKRSWMSQPGSPGYRASTSGLAGWLRVRRIIRIPRVLRVRRVIRVPWDLNLC